MTGFMDWWMMGGVYGLDVRVAGESSAEAAAVQTLARPAEVSLKQKSRSKEAPALGIKW